MTSLSSDGSIGGRWFDEIETRKYRERQKDQIVKKNIIREETRDLKKFILFKMRASKGLVEVPYIVDQLLLKQIESIMNYSIVFRCLLKSHSFVFKKLKTKKY